MNSIAYLIVLFLTIIALINHINSLNSFYLVNLDKYASEHDVSSASSQVQSIPKLLYTEASLSFQLTYSTKLEEEKNASIYLQETHSVLIDTLTITKDNIELEANKDYSIFPLISQGIIPNNYYEGYTKLSADSVMTSCTYSNALPTYQQYSMTNQAFKSIIHSKTMNIAISLDSDNMKAISFQAKDKEMTLQVKEITYDLSNIPQVELALFEAMAIKKYKQLFLLKSFYQKKEFFAALSKENSRIYVFEVNEKNSTVTVIGLCEINTSDDIRQVGMKGDTIYLGTDKGLRYGVKSGVKYVLNEAFTDNNKNILDLLVNNNTVYLINDIGLHIFDIGLNQYIMPNYIKHPLLKKLDYVPYNVNKTTSPYYIGIAVDNSPSLGYPEILIEIAPEGRNEIMPTLNRVYITNQNIKIENMVTDYDLGFTYIFDRETHKMYILKRAIPFFENTFSFCVDLSQDYPFEKPSMEDKNNKDFITVMKGEDNTISVVIMNANGLVVLNHLKIIFQSLTCRFKEKGEYSFNLYVDRDCSFIDEKTKSFVFQACKEKYYLKFKVQSHLNLIGVWIAIAILIAGVIGVIVFLLFFKSYCRKQKTDNASNSFKHKADQEANEDSKEKQIDIEIDNKL